MEALSPAGLETVKSAADRLKPIALRTPLIPLYSDKPAAQIYLKPENLQPTGSFKLRPAANAILNAPKELISKGVYTTSSGNMALGVAYTAKVLNIPATVLLPKEAPEAKVTALKRLGANIRYLASEAEFWQVLRDHGHPDVEGLFVHPVAHPDVIAGDATIGLEIFEDLPDVDTVIVPFGGGGLSTGIAGVMKELNPDVKILGAESDHCAPLAAAFAKGEPVDVPIQPTFVSGIGVGTILEQMWPLVRDLIDDSITVSAAEIVDTIRFLFEQHRMVVEGGGATSVAAGLAGCVNEGKIVCVISGGNINKNYLIDILNGNSPAI